MKTSFHNSSSSFGLRSGGIPRSQLNIFDIYDLLSNSKTNSGTPVEAIFAYNISETVGYANVISAFPGGQKVCELYNGFSDIVICLAVAGVLSNVLALLLVRNKSIGQKSARCYMTAYATSNILALTFLSGIDAVFCLLGQEHIRVVEDWVCRIWSFLAKVIVYSRIWFLLTLSLDRLKCMWFPQQASPYGSIFTARAVVLLVDTGLVVTSVHAMWCYRDASHGCFMDEVDVFVSFWAWSSNVVYFYLPLPLLLVVTACLCVSLLFNCRPQICSHRPYSRPQRTRSSLAAERVVVATVITCLCFIFLSAPKQAIDVVNVNFPSLWLHAGLNDQITSVQKIAETLYVIDHVLFGLVVVLCSTVACRCDDFLTALGNGHTNYTAACEAGFFQLDPEPIGDGDSEPGNTTTTV